MAQNINIISQLGLDQTQGLTGRDRAVAAIKQASSRTGVDFSYLLAEAKQESGLNAAAKASTSSATGLFQFIDQTWLHTVKRHGAEHGLSDVANKITVNAKGVAQVSNPADKRAILALRKNPEVASLMAAELASDNKESLQRTVGGEIGATDLYMAHFLGAGGARHFLKTMNANPNARAADVLPAAASANKNVFFDSKTGRARSVSEVYAFFDRKFDGVAGQEVNVRVASVAPSSSQVDFAHGPQKLFQPFNFNTDAYALGNGVTLSGAMNSPFATMMLAQMDMENFGFEALETVHRIDAYGAYGENNQKRHRSVISVLGQAA